MVLGHPGFDGDDGARNRVADLGARAPVDGRLRQVEEDVEDPRALRLAEEPVEELRVFWPDPWQGVGRREQGIESRGTHHAPLAAPDRPGKPDKPSALENEKTRAWEMDHDLPDAFVHAAYSDVLRRKRNDLSANLILPVIVGHDAHRVTHFPSVRIVGIVLGDRFGARLCRDAKGFAGGYFFADPVSDRSHAVLPFGDLGEDGEDFVDSGDRPIPSAVRFERTYQIFM